MAIGGFGTVLFEIAEGKLKSIEGQLSRTISSKISEHNPVNGVGMIRHQGRELIEISFKMNLIKQENVNPVEELSKLHDMLEVGTYNHLILGGNIVGDFPFIITSLSETMNNYIDGHFENIEVDISLKEYIEDPTIYEKLVQSKIQKTKITTEENLSSVEKEQALIADSIPRDEGGDINV